MGQEGFLRAGTAKSVRPESPEHRERVRDEWSGNTEHRKHGEAGTGEEDESQRGLSQRRTEEENEGSQERKESRNPNEFERKRTLRSAPGWGVGIPRRSLPMLGPGVSDCETRMKEKSSRGETRTPGGAVGQGDPAERNDELGLLQVHARYG